MRPRAYSYVLVAATFITLVATTIAADVRYPPLREYRFVSPRSLEVTERVFNIIAGPPQATARLAGIWINSHSAQLWPKGWPVFTALAMRLALISVPFWSAVGIVLYEIARAVSLAIRRVKNRAGGERVS